jgi:hypothetical protein
LARRINLIRHVLEGIVIVTLVTWGAYAIPTVSTSASPSSPGGTVNAVMRGVFVSTTYSAGAPYVNPIPPNSEAQFTMIFEANPTYNASKGWPQIYSVPRAEGTSWGPFLPSDPSSSSSSFTVRYAIFSFSLGAGVYWLTGPQGQLSTTYDLKTTPPTWVLEVDAPGNYTLRFDSAQSANATGQVTMSYSSVVFTPSRPYLYAGVATIGIAAAFSVATGYFSWRGKPTPQKPPHPGKEIPTDMLGHSGNLP